MLEEMLAAAMPSRPLYKAACYLRLPSHFIVLILILTCIYCSMLINFVNEQYDSSSESGIVKNLFIGYT